MKNKLIILIGVLLIIGCNRFDKGFVSVDSEVNKTYEVIEEDQALETLMAFMQRTEMMTKTGKERVIKSINTYPFMTKATDDPEAYVINFEDNAGFAVLGARSDMAEIIAVTENGNIDPVTLSIIDSPVFGDSLIVIPGIPVFGDDEVVVDTLTSDNIYCVEDDDYYIGGDISVFISSSITTGTKYRESPSMPVADYDYSSNDDVSTPTTNPPVRLNLKTQWDQDSPYNKKCKLQNNGNRRLAGCSSVAAGMILAYNKFPSCLYVNNTLLNWEEIRETEYLTSTSSEPVITHIPLLLGYFFWNCNRMAGKSYTMITPTQIKKRFGELGYKDLVLYKNSNFTNEMMGVTSQMIRNNKPVFVSAMRYAKKFPFVSGHSWVIEGVDSYNQMVYCNWGWEGGSNGYFSKNCFVVGDRDYEFHFRLLSYNIPTQTVVKYVGLD